LESTEGVVCHIYIYIDIHYSTWWYMNIFGTLCFCLESWCF
jgi:hypothetical protein